MTNNTTNTECGLEYCQLSFKQEAMRIHNEAIIERAIANA